MTITVESLATKHVQDAANLFISDYSKLGEHIPYLPLKYGQAETIAHLLLDTVKTQPGVVAISGGKLVGYLTGYAHIPNFKGISPGVYVPEWAHAASEIPDRKRILQSMYGAIAREWVSQGCFTHAITFFAPDVTQRDLLYWNGFGLLVVDAIRSTMQDEQAHEIDPAIAIRSATQDDLKGLLRLDNDLSTYLSQSPVFLYHGESDEQETAARFLGDKVISIVAEKNDRILACIRGTEQKQDSCTIVEDESIMGINFGFTDPRIRGTGVGAKILDKILEWGRSKGKTACAVDFESANVLGRSFWLRHFKAVCFSAIRFVDPKVAQDGQNQ